MSRRWMFVLVSAVAVAGCTSGRKTGGGDTPDPALTRCTGCHGDPANGNAAPPLSIHGETATTAVGVGAHQQHLQTTGIRQALDCSECHVVPHTVNEPGHIEKDRADLTWGPIASAGGVTPTYTRAPDGTTATCTNYCHGASFAPGNGTVHAPSWTKVDGSQAGCGACHGIPPPAPHPPAASIAACATCHPQTMNANGTINLAAGRHINGILDLVGGDASCTSCHGDPNRAQADIAPAPPRDTKGNTLETAPGVGAHQAHLVGTALRASLPCAACHTVPADLSHVNGTLDLTWGPLARTGGTTPTFNATTVTCTNYCHGNPSLGGTNNSPVWTGGAAQAVCGSCHGIPPSAPHPPVNGGATACAACHPGTVKADGTIDVAGGRHVNGAIEVNAGSCTACHGDPNRANATIAAAPPKDTAGNTATTAPGVGAHQAHLTAANLVASPIGCGECHIVPSTLAHAAQPLNLTWGPLASAGGTAPTFDSTATTCTNYCHGATLTGGTRTAPVWTGGAAEAACGTCHGVPPTSGQHGIAEHAPYIASCATCHGNGYTPTAVSKAVHLNGVRDVSATAPITSWNAATRTCTALCHVVQTEVRTW